MRRIKYDNYIISHLSPSVIREDRSASTSSELLNVTGFVTRQ